MQLIIFLCVCVCVAARTWSPQSTAAQRQEHILYMDTVTPQNGQLHSNGSTMKVGLLNQAETTHWLTKRLTRKITEWLNSQQQQFISQGNHSVNWSVKHTKSINPFISLSLTLLVLVNQPASHSVCQSLFLLVCLCVGASLFLSYKLISVFIIDHF